MQHRSIAHAVAVLERALEDVGDDFHVKVRMLAKTLARRDTIFVHHAKRAEAHVAGIVIIGERKRVIRVQPSVIGMAALMTSANFDHRGTSVA